MAESKPRVQRSDAVGVGAHLEVIFEGLEPGQGYRVHVLLPSGESVYRKVTATKDGEVTFKHPTQSQATHVVELHEGPHDEREVIAAAHVTVLPVEEPAPE